MRWFFTICLLVTSLPGSQGAPRYVDSTPGTPRLVSLTDDATMTLLDTLRAQALDNRKELHA